MTKDIYLWSDNEKDSSISYNLINEGKVEEFSKRDVRSIAKIVNDLKNKGYSVHIDQTWLGVEMRIPGKVRSKLLELIKMEEPQKV